MQKMKIILPGILPGKNEQINADRRNHFIGNRLKQQTQEALFWPIRIQSHGAKFTDHVTVRVVFYEPWNRQHRRDDDNIIHGCKYILDELVNMGILPDDNPKFVKLLPQRETECGDKGIRIEITIQEDGKTWEGGRLVAKKEARNG